MYIRTKDNVYKVSSTIVDRNNEVLSYDYSYSYSNGDGTATLVQKTISPAEVLKKGDTVEEVIDAYWWENTDFTDPIYNPNKYVAEERLEEWLKSDKELHRNDLNKIDVYGSIYIKGYGWKHVSKLYIDQNGKVTELYLHNAE